MPRRSTAAHTALLLLHLAQSTSSLKLAPPATTPPPSKHAQRLRSMMDAVSVGDAALALVPDPLERTLLRGVRAALAEPAVVEAFTILYEDIAPIRIAGALVFQPLEARVAAANASEAQLAAEVAYAPEELEAARRLFDLVDADGSGLLDRDELLTSGLLSGRATEVQIDELMAKFDRDGDQQISFVEFMLSATQLLFIDNSDGGCGISIALAQAEESVRQERGARGGEAPGSPRRDQAARGTPDERFDQMLVSVEGWAEAVEARRAARPESSHPGRIERVLEGSIVGGRNKHVVAALRLCYTKHLPLRLMGDLIFRLIEGVMREGG